ncbi:MAG: NAD-dependent epimerase [Firmicutes bacterium HGW-Firmicutes-8]|nr:MAG: NAD-dependent epimerase [Firmicutes bacterium HGW-Firmicutes-8]
MNCTVLGGGGFLGSHICEELIKAGFKVKVFERDKSRKANIEHLLNKIDWMEGDFCNPSDIEKALTGTDLVFHLICTTLPKTSNDNLALDIETNVVPTLRMLKTAKKARVKKVIFFSSGGTVYGVPEQVPIKESHSNEPICSYGIHKLTIEKYLHLFNHLYGLDYGILRMSNPFGPRQSPYGSQGAVPVFINKALKKEPIEIWGDGSVVRDYIYVSDVAKAVLALLEYKGDKKSFNIGSCEGRSLLEVIKVVEAKVGYPLEVVFQPSRSLDVPVNILDISRARKELLWQPETSFLEGVSLTVEYLKKVLN